MIEKLKQSHPKIYKHFFTVTTFSKIVALSLFIILPFVGFYLGMKYEQEVNVGTPTLSAVQQVSVPGNVGLANPAAVYCNKQGGENKIITESDGSQLGQCIFPDGRKCDDWQFFRTKICK